MSSTEKNMQFRIYLIVSNCWGFPVVDLEIFLVCQRSFANVVKLIVRDSTGQDNSWASMIWHGVHILETFSIKKQELLLVLYLNNSPGTDFCHIDGLLNLAASFHCKSELRTFFLTITYCDCLIDQFTHQNLLPSQI